MPTGTTSEVCPAWNDNYKSLASDMWSGPAEDSIGCKIATDCVKQIEHHSNIRCVFNYCADIWSAEEAESAPLVLFCTHVRNALRRLFEEKMVNVSQE